MLTGPEVSVGSAIPAADGGARVGFGEAKVVDRSEAESFDKSSELSENTESAML